MLAGPSLLTLLMRSLPVELALVVLVVLVVLVTLLVPLMLSLPVAPGLMLFCFLLILVPCFSTAPFLMGVLALGMDSRRRVIGVYTPRISTVELVVTVLLLF